jgi:hypothetical protein
LDIGAASPIASPFCNAIVGTDFFGVSIFSFWHEAKSIEIANNTVKRLIILVLVFIEVIFLRLIIDYFIAI